MWDNDCCYNSDETFTSKAIAAYCRNFQSMQYRKQNSKSYMVAQTSYLQYDNYSDKIPTYTVYLLMDCIKKAFQGNRHSILARLHTTAHFITQAVPKTLLLETGHIISTGVYM